MSTETERGKYSLPEILNQPNAWADIIGLTEARGERLRRLADGVGEVVFTGCGSALNVSVTLAPTFQHITGVKARFVPAAEVVFFPQTVFTGDTNYLVVLISRSGETTETVTACEVVQTQKMKTLSITCYPESHLAQATDEALVLEAANEKAVVTTQSLTGMVLCGQVMAAAVAGDADYLKQLKHLPELGRRVIEEYHSLSREIAENEQLTKFAFVGNGPYFGLAKECQLKVKEMVLQPADCYPVFDFRHGPKSNVDSHMLVTVLMSDSARSEESVFIRDMKALNGSVLVLCDSADRDIKEAADYVVEVGSGLPEFARDILYIPPVHFLAYYRSLARGLDPDTPTNLTYWVEM